MTPTMLCIPVTAAAPMLSNRQPTLRVIIGQDAAVMTLDGRRQTLVRMSDSLGILSKSASLSLTRRNAPNLFTEKWIGSRSKLKAGALEPSHKRSKGDFVERPARVEGTESSQEITEGMGRTCDPWGGGPHVVEDCGGGGKQRPAARLRSGEELSHTVRLGAHNVGPGVSRKRRGKRRLHGALVRGNDHGVRNQGSKGEHASKVGYKKITHTHTHTNVNPRLSTSSVTNKSRGYPHSTITNNENNRDGREPTYPISHDHPASARGIQHALVNHLRGSGIKLLDNDRKGGGGWAVRNEYMSKRRHNVVKHQHTDDGTTETKKKYESAPCKHLFRLRSFRV